MMEEFEDLNPEFERNLEQWREKMINSAIQTNYNVIAENGIDPYHLKTLGDQDMISLVSTLKLMINHFEALEEYEKCALLNKELLKVEMQLESTRSDI